MGTYFRHLKKLLLPLIALMLTALVSSFAVFCYPLLEKVVFDTLIITYDKDLLVMVLYATGALVVITLLATLFIELLSSYIQISLVKKIREEMTEKVLQYRYGFFKTCDFGEIVERIIPEVETIATVITTTVKYATYALQIVLILGITLFLDRLLFVVYLVLVAFHMIWHLKTRELLGSSDKAVRDREGKLYSFFFSQIREIKEVKLFNLQQQRLLHLDEEQDLARRATLKSAFMSHLHGLCSYLPRITAIIVLVLFFDAYKSGDVTLGFYFLFTGMLFLIEFPVSQVIELGATLERGKQAVSRLEEIANEEGETSGTLVLRRVHEQIEFHDLYFAYDEKPILQGISFTLERGANIALVGSSGTGKSTLASLLLRLYDPQGGGILIDGQKISQYSLESLRDRIGILSQEPFLFNDTIKVNVDLHNTHSEKDIKAALRLARLEKYCEFIDKPVGENGLQVSMGEKQRIALARLLLRNCAVIVFDEATAHLDPATEAEIMETIATIRETHPDLITITISHRIATVAKCDEVLYLENGQVKERCAFEDIARKPYFSQLFTGEGHENIEA